MVQIAKNDIKERVTTTAKNAMARTPGIIKKEGATAEAMKQVGQVVSMVKTAAVTKGGQVVAEVKTAAVREGGAVVGKIKTRGESVWQKMIGSVIAASCFQVMTSSFKPAITSPYKMNLLYSNDVFKDKYVHLNSLAHQLHSFKDGVDEPFGDHADDLLDENDDPLHESINRSTFQDLHAFAPTILEPPTRLQRMRSVMDAAVVETRELITISPWKGVGEGKKSEDGSQISSGNNNNHNDTKISNSNIISDSNGRVGDVEADAVVSGWTQLRQSLDEATNDGASKMIRFLQAKKEDLGPLVMSNVKYWLRR